MIIVLDASALLRFLDDEPGAERVQQLLSRARRAELEILISAVNWGELIYAVARKSSADTARALGSKLSTLPITVVGCDIDDATEAGLFKDRFKLPYADAIAGSLALRRSATLVTADYDFKTLPAGTIKVDFLPTK